MTLSQSSINSTTTIKGIQKLLSTEEVAILLGTKPQTLAIWRHKKRYCLPFVKIGRLVKYRPQDVEKFVTERTVGA
jgi:excisionase family DNA binding protein